MGHGLTDGGAAAGDLSGVGHQKKRKKAITKLPTTQNQPPR